MEAVPTGYESAVTQTASGPKPIPDLPSSAAAGQAGDRFAPRLVLVALASPEDPHGPSRLLPQVAWRLAGLTGVPVQPMTKPDFPSQALAPLVASPGAWIAPLPLDPGLWLPGGGWAEALGAWRQPTLLVVDQGQLATGMPAAATALLLGWNVPLLGLLQWGGSWDGGSRRRDGLPWLGRLAETADPVESAEAAVAAEVTGDHGDQGVLLALNRRWSWLADLLR